MVGPGTTFTSSRSAATPTMRRPFLLTPMKSVTGSVHISLRLTASCPGNMRRARLSLTITTFSASSRSSALKSRPATMGTPSESKNPEDTVRNCARGSSSPLAF